MPRHISHLIGGIFEQGRRVAKPGVPEGEPLAGETGRFDAWLGAPRAAAVAVMGMLGFGVVVGSLVSGSAASPLGPIIVALSPAGPHSTSSPLGAWFWWRRGHGLGRRGHDYHDDAGTTDQHQPELRRHQRFRFDDNE